jgi:hypothetical protein
VINETKYTRRRRGEEEEDRPRMKSEDESNMRETMHVFRMPE